MNLNKLALVLLLLIPIKSLWGQGEAVQLIDKMIAANKRVNTLEVNVEMSERIKNKMVDMSSFFKLQSSPRKIYFRQKFLLIDVEGLYVEGQNENKTRIVTHSFPKIKMNLDPYGNKMRDNHHHTIFEAGYSYFINLIDHYKTKYASEIPSMTQFLPDAKVDDRVCKVIELNNPHFRYTLYTPVAGETLRGIAEKLKVNDRMILEMNPSCKDYGPVKAGQKLIVPTDYAKKMVLYIDKGSYLPLRFDVYDDKGLYARYIYTKVQINPAFGKQEFSPSNPSYKFE
jgi:hypothetical protein